MDAEAATLVAGLEPLVATEAPLADAAGRLTPPLAEAFVDRGLWKLWVPRAYGGRELPLPASLEVFEAVAAMDGACGWAVTIGTGGGPFAAYLEPAAAAEIFGPKEALIAGSGTPSGTAVRVEGGYRAQGRWAYASGAHQATWFTANCFIEGETGTAGGPRIRAMAFPAAAVRFVPASWEVTGMRATGSITFEAGPVAVPATHTFSVFDDAPRVPGALYRFPFASIAELSFAAVALGVARHAITAYRELAVAPRPLHPPALHERPAARARFAEALASVEAARSWLFATANAAWATVASGGELSPEVAATVKLASVHAADASVRAAQLLAGAGGMASIVHDSPLGRCRRDLETLAAHVMVSPAWGYEAAGGRLLPPSA